MKTRMFGLLTVVGLLTAAAVAYAQKVTIDSDPAAPFATFKTYAWTMGTPSPNPLGEQRIHEAVNAQLAARGMTEVHENPDLYVATHLTAREEKELVSTGFGYGPWGYGGGSYSTSVHTYIKGTLLVDLYDAKTKKMVWRGSATATASDKPASNTKKVNKAIAKMFERYPGINASSR